MIDLGTKFRRSRDYDFEALIRDLQDYHGENNAALDVLTAAVAARLKRDGSEPMLGSLDMDGFNLLNVGGYPGTLYERGTWTPTLFGIGGTSGPPIYSAQFGFFTRINGVAFVSFRLVVTDMNGMTGVLRLEGFPFTHTIQSGAGNREVINIGFYAGMSAPVDASRIFGWMQDALPSARLYWEETQLGKATTGVNETNIVPTFTIYGSGFYSIY